MLYIQHRHTSTTVLYFEKTLLALAWITKQTYQCWGYWPRDPGSRWSRLWTRLDTNTPFCSFSCTCTEHGGNLFKSKGQEESSKDDNLKGVFIQINDQVRGKTRGTCRFKIWLTKKNDKTHVHLFFCWSRGIRTRMNRLTKPSVLKNNLT